VTQRLAYKKGFGLVEIMVVLAIIALIYYLWVNNYFKARPFSKETEKVLSESGIDTSRPDTILKTVKEKLKKITEQKSADSQE